MSPAIVVNGRQDLLAANLLGRAPDWNLAADMLVANLRTAAGKDPHDKAGTIWSGSCRSAATTSAAAGVRTTCVPTAPVSKGSAITRPVTCSSLTRAWICAPSRTWS
jgi:hypothetical protein